jgi:hypothetical protein
MFVQYILYAFKNRIKIAKGINLNLSKSGLSTSFGNKGLSFTVGNKGTYVNYGIPGTGLYDRKKLSSNSPNSSTKPISRGNKFQNEAPLEIQLNINDSGDIQIFDSPGLYIPAGVAHSGESIARTRTIHAFGGKELKEKTDKMTI